MIYHHLGLTFLTLSNHLGSNPSHLLVIQGFPGLENRPRSARGCFLPLGLQQNNWYMIRLWSTPDPVTIQSAGFFWIPKKCNVIPVVTCILNLWYFQVISSVVPADQCRFSKEPTDDPRTYCGAAGAWRATIHTDVDVFGFANEM